MRRWRAVAEAIKALVFLVLGAYLLTVAERYHEIPEALRNLLGATLIAYATFKVVRLVGLLRTGGGGRLRSGHER